MTADTEVRLVTDLTGLTVQINGDCVTSITPVIGVILRLLLTVTAEAPFLCMAGLTPISALLGHEADGLTMELLPVRFVTFRFYVPPDGLVAVGAVVLDVDVLLLRVAGDTVLHDRNHLAGQRSALGHVFMAHHTLKLGGQVRLM